ncbi:MAG: DNA polymerase III subunit delta' [Deltaproteobacteria bacterium]
MSFLDIYGHEKQIVILKQALAQNRVGHSYLFSGIDATGKKTLALEFAKIVNCENADEINDSCEKCPVCLKINRHNHPDIFLIEAEGQFIRIGAIREIQEQMTFRPMEGRKRVYVIDNADRMNEQAANALLKTLEEPSPANILILVTAKPYSLPSTIISRCRHMRFNPVAIDTVAKFLVERQNMEKQSALLLAGLSGGSIGQALELNKEDVIAYRAEILKMLANTKKSDPMSLLAFAAFFGQDKREIKQGFNIVQTCFRDALVYKETQNSQMLINQDKSSLIASLASGLTGLQILQNITLMEKAYETMEQNVNKTLTLETMAFKLQL